MKGLKEVKTVTSGVLGTVIDLMLWQVYLVGASVGKSGPAGVYQAFDEANRTLEQVNHRTIYTAWKRLSKRKLITYEKRGDLYNFEITKFGMQRLNRLLPAYQKKRPWNRKIYLITYDIPESGRNKRDSLRRFLIKLGCKLFQESVFITPYNPREIINKFIKLNKIPGTIIVSDIGKDGGIGEITLQNMLAKIYNLERLNEKYEIFLDKTKISNPDTLMLFEYLAILKEDPQLPFAILPKWWLGEKAYQKYEEIMRRIFNTRRGRDSH